MHCGLWGAVVILFGGAATAQAQEGAAPDPLVIRTQVRQVLVPFVVIDQHGRHVTGLKASDVQVSEDGNPERIVAFSAQNPVEDGSLLPRGDSSRIVKPARSPVVRETYLIVVDTLHSSPGNFGRVRQALSKHLE